MENQDLILDGEHTEKTSDIEVQYIISLNKFIFLSIISLGLYEGWWIYKAWRFFKQKEKLDIQPVSRTIFGIFFLNGLLVKIMDYALDKKYKEGYTPSLLFIGFFGTSFLSNLPEPYWLISLISFVFLIAPFKALNYAKQHSADVITEEQHSYNRRQLVLIIVGALVWLLLILGMTGEALGIV